MLGFKKFYDARRVLIGVELMQMIHKSPFWWAIRPMTFRSAAARSASATRFCTNFLDPKRHDLPDQIQGDWLVDRELN